MRRSSLTALASLFLLTALLFSACSTSRPTAREGPSAPSKDVDKGLSAEEQELQQLLNRTRDVLASRQENEHLEVPQAFRKAGSGSGENILKNPYQGFRVQLISTRDVQKADTVAAEFDEWIEEVLPSYPAKSYVTFHQPYYKVHVGDFHNRTRANGFTRLLKEKYPDAWIVPDRIDPSGVAADSVHFSEEDDPNDFK